MCNQNSEAGLASFCPAALLACIAISPFYLSNPGKGPAPSPVCTYACLAFLGGQVLGSRPRFRAVRNGRFRGLLLFSAALLVEVFVLPEWELLGDYAAALLAYEPFVSLGVIAKLIHTAQAPVLSIASALAGAAGAPTPLPATSADDRPGHGAHVPLIALAMSVAYSSRVIWLAIFPLEGPAGRALPLLAPGPGFVLLVFAAALLYMGILVLLARRWRARRLPSSALGTVYALGMLLWALLTRVAPLYGNLMLSLMPALVLVGVSSLAWLLPKPQRNAQPSGNDSKPTRPAKVGSVLPTQITDADITARELQVVELALEGNASSQIASELGISASTARGTLAKAYKKIGVSNLEELKTIGEPPVRAAKASTSVDGGSNSSWNAFRRVTPLVLAALPLLPIAAVSKGWGQGQPLLLGVGFALVATSMLCPQMGASLGSKAFGWRRAAATALLVTADATALVAAFCLSTQMVDLPRGFLRVLEFVSGATVAIALLVLWPESRPATDECASSTPLTYASFALGLSLEELWRFASGASGFFGLLPFLLAMGCLLLRSHAVSKAKLLRPCPPLSSASLCLAFGCGALFGVFAMNLLGDRCLVWQEALGVPVQTGTLLCLATALVSIPGIRSLYIIYQSICSEYPVQLAPTSTERIEGYLVSQGLTPTESQTAMCIARNLTTRQIATRLNYSVGAINSARRGAYAKLNIRSKEDLLELFAQFKDV